MHAQYCRRNEINFVTDCLTLPLFLASRISARKTVGYIIRTEQIIKKTCEKAKQPHMKMRSVYEKLIRKYAGNPQPCINLRRIKMLREHSDNKSFHLLPNIYAVEKIPFEQRRGLGGAYWHRLPQTKSKLDGKEAKGENWQFYNIPRDSDRLRDRHNQYKGKFQTKTTKPPFAKWYSSRNLAAMRSKAVNNSLVMPCNVKQRGIFPKITPSLSTPKKYIPKPNPHLFLRNSCIPEKSMSYIPRHQSFLPAVGRYKIRNTNTCRPCKLTKKKRSNSQTATVSSQQLSGGQGCLRHMLHTATLTPAKRLDNKQEPNIFTKLLHNSKPRKRVPISRRPQNLMPTIHSNIRFNSIVAVPRLNTKRASKCPTTHAASTSKKAQLCRKEAAAPEQLACKVEYKPNFKFKPLPSPKILITKQEIFGDISSRETQCFYFRNLDINKYLKNSTVKIVENCCLKMLE